MPYLPNAQEWLTQSSLLLQAHPDTTRINTKYTLINPSKTLSAIKKSTGKPKLRAAKPDARAIDTPVTKARLMLKTYNPGSGVTLKYETDKAAEVGRLVLACARLGRGMVGLEMKEHVTIMDAGAETAESAAPVVGSGIATPVPEAKITVTGAQGGKKKKKGKK